MNTQAITLPRNELLSELIACTGRRQQAIAARDAALGPGRVRYNSYMENIGWPELLGFDMNDVLTDGDRAIETEMRQRIMWADNADDDNPVTLDFLASTGMYYDMTLFGQRIRHTTIGVPEFQPHPLAAEPRPELIAPFDFQSTGDMPALIAKYRRMRELSAQVYGGRLNILFPHFHRGPLDVLVQLRGYENFVADCVDQPAFVHAMLHYFVDERLRYARERQAFLGEPALPPTTFVADDWVNVPFIKPSMFREFVVPVYRRIVAEEGPVTGFHTCGSLNGVVDDLLAVFPDMRRLEVSGWNDLLALDAETPPEIGFDVQVINTLVLAGSEEQQRAKLEDIARVRRHRNIVLCAQAMVKLYSYEDTFARLNAFLALARQMLR